MAYSQAAKIVSLTAGTTFADTDLYKFVDLDTDGNVIISVSTNNSLPIGVLYSRTATTSTDSEKVDVAYAGVVKVRMAGSTRAAGDWVTASSAGLGAVGSSNRYVVGKLVVGTSGTTGRIATMQIIHGPLSAP